MVRNGKTLDRHVHVNVLFGSSTSFVSSKTPAQMESFGSLGPIPYSLFSRTSYTPGKEPGKDRILTMFSVIYHLASVLFTTFYKITYF